MKIVPVRVKAQIEEAYEQYLKDIALAYFCGKDESSLQELGTNIQLAEAKRTTALDLIEGMGK